MTAQIVTADDFLAHYGKKGMKWGVTKSEARTAIRAERDAINKDINASFKGRKGVAKAGVSIAAGVAATPFMGLTVATTMMTKTAGYSTGKAVAINLLGGPIGAMVAVEVKARQRAKFAVS